MRTEGIKGRLRSLLSLQGVSQLKEKWADYRQPPKLRKWTALFVSSRGERVAVAIGNQITILQKNDDFREPCGIFTSSCLVTFTCGAWSEGHDVLGVADNADSLYFIRANGEEITRVTKGHLKVSSEILGLIVQDDFVRKTSCLCTFSALTSDGSLHTIELSQDPSASISTACSSNGSLHMKQFPQNVFCLSYHSESLLLAVVSGASSISATSTDTNGLCSLSLWQRTGGSDLKSIASAQFEGTYAKSKSSLGPLTSPKVLFSPRAEYVATLDLRGCLFAFKLGDERSLSIIYFGDGCTTPRSNISSATTQHLSSVVDFTWWSDHILIIANKSGSITMFDVGNGVKCLEDCRAYSKPILERVQQFPGNVFLLESISSADSTESPELLLMEPVTAERYRLLESSNLHWRLVSFSERSVREMYDVLIGSQKYHYALEFAARHGLDKDEVLKSQWLHSDQGQSDIKMFLSHIKDQTFVVSECVGRSGPTEDAVRDLLAYGLRITNNCTFSKKDDDESCQIWDFRLARLKLLQFRDRLETFLGINMGRFSVQDYAKFRVLPINEAAVELAESGKIGALNLLFKRHPYSLAPFILEILAAIPETVPVQTYSQLLPGNSPPPVTSLREVDWVECKEMVNFISTLPNDIESSIHIRTEHIVKQLLGFRWPSTDELSIWYKSRAVDIDALSGQLDNSLCLVDFACRKGINVLQQLTENISYLHQLVYSACDDEVNFTTSLAEWEQLSDFEKFKFMLKGVSEENVVKRLRDKAVPFMKKRFDIMHTPIMDEFSANQTSFDRMNGSFLVNWMKEVAKENKLDICLVVIEEGCREFGGRSFFINEVEAVDCAIQCIYLSTATDRWSTMASILSKLPQLQDYDADGLKQRLKLAEGHVEAGTILAFYQVPKPISFFLDAHSDGKGVKQILRLILSKFARRQPGRTDNDWANMWHDFQSLQEKAFPFVDLEYMLLEFCRGLLKAGKFSLARSYLKGFGALVLPTDKAENLVIQASREYFYSASSLTSTEIWKAKECLNIIPASRNVRAEADVIDALTNKLPNLGVYLLPLQFRQIKDRMEIIKLAIRSQVGAYLNVEEIIEIAKLLGLSSVEEISAVQESIAREAAVAGDLQLAFDLCLALANKGHGSVWDLCAALARGPALENMDISSRKHLLGFALSHCDEESIGELLHAWKDLDIQRQCERLEMLAGKGNPQFLGHDSSFASSPLHYAKEAVDLRDWSGQFNGIACDEQNIHFRSIKNTLSDVSRSLSVENASNWESVLKENGKFWAFVALHLPWLLELSQETENGKKLVSGSVSGKLHSSVRAQAVTAAICWLAWNGYAPSDNLIAMLVKSVIEPPVTEEEDIIGCSFVLNLIDAFYGVEIIEEEVKKREDYDEISSFMDMGMLYSSLHNSGAECTGPAQRRELLLRKFQEKHTSISSDEREKIDREQSSFWREWKMKLEEQKRVADRTRVIDQIIPGVETERFLSGDVSYMENVVFSLVQSVKSEKKRILKDVLKLAYEYGLDHGKVLLEFLGSVLVSEVWTNDDIEAEISDYKGEILKCAEETIKTITLNSYPAIDGCNKLRLAYIYELLSVCYKQLGEAEGSSPVTSWDPANINSLGLVLYYSNIGSACKKISFIEDLNFKNIAGLHGLNLECFSSEVDSHITEKNVEELAEMVDTLVSVYGDRVPEGLVSGNYVYRHHVEGLLTTMECSAKSHIHFQSPESVNCFIDELEQTYDKCKKYLKVPSYPIYLDLFKQFITPILYLKESLDTQSFDFDSTWKDCLVILVTFWSRLTDDMQELLSSVNPEDDFSPICFSTCLKIFFNLVVEGKVSPRQGWETIFTCVDCCLVGGASAEIFNFCRSMIFSGCRFEAVTYLFSEVISQFPSGLTSARNTPRNTMHFGNIMDLPHLYLSILETLLSNLSVGSVERQNLQHALSSLSIMQGDIEELKKVRHAVWETMVKFSDDLQLPSHSRVYILEIMQTISSTGKPLNTFTSELLGDILPWEGWDEVGSRSSNNWTATSNEGSSLIDASCRLTTTLVALKSSQLVSAILPSMEVTPDDLLNADSAVSCFLKLSSAAIAAPHIDSLVTILREWEQLFTIAEKDDTTLAEVSDGGNDWGDDWDEGWESFQEEPAEKETKEGDSDRVHPLHACWAEILKKLSSLSRYRDMLNLIDQSYGKRGGVLLDKDDACRISQTLLNVDCFMALKIIMLLPYRDVHLQCLEAVEVQLKQEGMSDASLDHEFFVLVLHSGLISTIVTQPSFGTTFSYINCMVGKFSRQSLEVQLLRLKNQGAVEKGPLILFRRILFPWFVAELVKADQQILAGFLVTKIMHTNASLSLLNVAEASLTNYLEKQLEVLRSHKVDFEEMDCEPLGNTIMGLNSGLENLIQSVLPLLSKSNIR